MTLFYALESRTAAAWYDAEYDVEGTRLLALGGQGRRISPPSALDAKLANIFGPGRKRCAARAARGWARYLREESK